MAGSSEPCPSTATRDAHASHTGCPTWVFLRATPFRPKSGVPPTPQSGSSTRDDPVSNSYGHSSGCSRVHNGAASPRVKSVPSADSRRTRVPTSDADGPVDSHVLLVMVTIEFWMRKPSLLGPSPLEFDGFAIRASPALEMGDLSTLPL
ncbi:hypothetical protein EG328_007962 [Venturia inaequalis]|uniref:Uncharacterized protein n=1 Tax=Venturia inaequalis TaxID=5025 RepID=A0A8H3UCW4_VENIN|nr:hypothetical protein EG328_007962 [Venturia inaequalis]